MNYRRLGKNPGLGSRCFRTLEVHLADRIDRKRRGPPFRHAARLMLFMALMRLRTALPLRLMARLFAVAHVTLWRYCNLVVEFLSRRFDGAVCPHGSRELIVDTTSTRVRCTDRVWHSGYKKQRVAKVQVLCDAEGFVHSVSTAYPGSVHDKTIWNAELGTMPKDVTVLADKAYAGGAGEAEVLFRPARRNEQEWKRNPEGARTFNAALSKRRVRIEHVFAQLKTWRIIHHYYSMRPRTYDATSKAIAYIHNLSRLEKIGKLM